MSDAPSSSLPDRYWETRPERSLAGGLMGMCVASGVIGLAAGLLPFGVIWFVVRPGAAETALLAAGLCVPGFFLGMALIARGLDRRLTAPMRAVGETMYGILDELGRHRLRVQEASELGFLAAAADELMHQVERARNELANQRRALQKGVERETELLARRNLEMGRAKREAENAVIALKEAQAHLVQQERMATLGQLLAGIAHEINNPVNFMVNATGPLHANVDALATVVSRLEPSDEDAQRLKKVMQDTQRAVGLIEAGAARTARIVQSLRTFSRAGSGERTWFDLRDGIDLTLELLTPMLKDRIEVIRDYVDVRSVHCSQGEVNQVFMNLLSNAAQAIQGEGAIRIAVRELDLGVVVQIEDSGVGMSDEVRERIFDPFFTTKKAGEGTGLGLPISLNIVQNHGGTIDVESSPGVGSKFRVWLPYEAPEAANSVPVMTV